MPFKERIRVLNLIDLHTHTNYSDGTATVEETLSLAEKLGLSFLSVTDHNTVNAYDELLQKKHLFSGKLVSGVELGTTFRCESIEILGYGINIEKIKPLISENYLSFYEKNVRAAALDAIATVKNGAALSPDFVKTMCEHPEAIFDPERENDRPYLLAELQRHPENARFFGSRDEFESITRHRFTREYLFNPQSPLFSDQSSLVPSIEKVIRIIKECGGLAFLAHPFVYSENIINALDEVVAYGLDGIECYYGTFNEAQKQFLEAYSDKNGLLKSGGSDHHGLDMRPNNIMGRSAGEAIPYSLVSSWIDKIAF